MCVDYHQLNELTIKKIPITKRGRAIGWSSYLPKLDLRSGYHQFRLSPADTYKTAF